MDRTDTFNAVIEIIGINPFVFIPPEVLDSLFKQAGKNRGPIPVCGTINKKPYTQTLVKYQGEWRLYVNMVMLKNSPKRIGESITVTISHDPLDRRVLPHPKLMHALAKNPEARRVFDGLPPYLQKEIIRYISFLKTESSVDRNVAKAIDFLLGKGRFVGRAKP